MQKCYVAFFPELPKSHWIHDFRKMADEKSHLVAPHLTLVFPTEKFNAKEMAQEVALTTKGFDKFKIRIRSAMLIPETKSTGYIFLVPDEGFGQVLRLRDQLHSQSLKSECRLDMAFVPHITIGSNLELKKAKALIDELNSQNFDLEFTVDKLTVVEILDSQKDRLLGAEISLKA